MAGQLRIQVFNCSGEGDGDGDGDGNGDADGRTDGRTDGDIYLFCMFLSI